MKSPTERFSTRVSNYTLYRPSYPPAILDLLRRECGLTPYSEMADVGSGTGILSKLFLDNGNVVYAVEPNNEMREEAERLLGNYSNFKSINATAEDTSLPPRSVDFVTAAQAFHWFDPPCALGEFKRILRPDGWVVLIWNTRRQTATPFLSAYAEMLRTYSDEYLKVYHQRPDVQQTLDMLLPSFKRATFENSQLFDFEGVKGRLLSSSYAPEQDHPRHKEMLVRLREIFDRYQVNGRVVFEYDTRVYYGGPG